VAVAGYPRSTKQDADGKPVEKVGILAFGREPNPDANDGTFVGTFLDVTRSEGL